MTDYLTTDIDIAYPDDVSDLHLDIGSNGCTVRIAPGEGDAWVKGISTYKRLPGPSIEQNGNTVLIYQKYQRSDLTNLFRVASDSPTLELNMGRTNAFALKLETTGDSSQLELGGLPITAFNHAQKLGPAVVSFNEPNPVKMSEFQLEVHAAQFEAHQLPNANFEWMRIEGNASTCKLYFEGNFQRDARIELKAKETPTSLFVPKGIAVRVLAEEAELDTEDIEFEADEDFIRHKDGYYTQAAIDGVTPLLTIIVTPLGPLAVHIL